MFLTIHILNSQIQIPAAVTQLYRRREQPYLQIRCCYFRSRDKSTCYRKKIVANTAILCFHAFALQVEPLVLSIAVIFLSCLFSFPVGGAGLQNKSYI